MQCIFRLINLVQGGQKNACVNVANNEYGRRADSQPQKDYTKSHCEFPIACPTKRVQRVEDGKNAVVLPRLQSDRSAHVANKSLHTAAPPKYGVMRDLWIYWSQALWSLNSASVLKHLAGTVSFAKYTQQNLPWQTNTRSNTREINRFLRNKNVYYSRNSRIRQWSLTLATKIWSTASRLIFLRTTLILSVHIHFSLPSGIFSSAFRLHFARIYYIFLVPHIYPSWFDHPHNVMKNTYK